MSLAQLPWRCVRVWVCCHRVPSNLLALHACAVSCRNQSIRGVPGGDTAILKAAAAAAASGLHERELQPQLSLGGLMTDLTAAAHNEAKVRAACGQGWRPVGPAINKARLKQHPPPSVYLVADALGELLTQHGLLVLPAAAGCKLGGGGAGAGRITRRVQQLMHPGKLSQQCGGRQQLTAAVLDGRGCATQGAGL